MTWNWDIGIVETIMAKTGSVLIAMAGLDYYRGEKTKKEFIDAAKHIRDVDNFQIITVLTELDELKKMSLVEATNKGIMRNWYKPFGDQHSKENYE